MTLVDTSPVGVVVMKARTGNPVSFNRNVLRIVVAPRTPGQSLEQLLEVLDCHTGDERELSEREFPMALGLNNGTRARAEEIVLQVPNGRSVTALLKATPIRSEDGTVESAIVTLQNLIPMRELDRLRAEFLAAVSPELRVPLTSIYGSAATTLRASPTPIPPAVPRFPHIVDEPADYIHSVFDDLLDAGRFGMGTLSDRSAPGSARVMADRGLMFRD